MKLVGRKTRKVIRKSVKKIVKKHGGKIAAGLAGGICVLAGNTGEHRRTGQWRQVEPQEGLEEGLPEGLEYPRGRRRKRAAQTWSRREDIRQQADRSEVRRHTRPAR
jgi:hypothetical protein